VSKLPLFTELTRDRRDPGCRARGPGLASRHCDRCDLRGDEVCRGATYPTPTRSL